jgi:hypothetical protein
MTFGRWDPSRKVPPWNGSPGDLSRWVGDVGDERAGRLEARIERLEAGIQYVLDHANGQTPELVYVGKGFTLGELRHALLALLHDPPGPPPR